MNYRLGMIVVVGLLIACGLYGLRACASRYISPYVGDQEDASQENQGRGGLAIANSADSISANALSSLPIPDSSMVDLTLSFGDQRAPSPEIRVPSPAGGIAELDSDHPGVVVRDAFTGIALQDWYLFELGNAASGTVIWRPIVKTTGGIKRGRSMSTDVQIFGHPILHPGALGNWLEDFSPFAAKGLAIELLMELNSPVIAAQGYVPAHISEDVFRQEGASMAHVDLLPAARATVVLNDQIRAEGSDTLRLDVSSPGSSFNLYSFRIEGGGPWRVANLLPGSYVFSISANGFEEEPARVAVGSVVRLEAGQETYVELSRPEVPVELSTSGNLLLDSGELARAEALEFALLRPVLDSSYSPQEIEQMRQSTRVSRRAYSVVSRQVVVLGDGEPGLTSVPTGLRWTDLILPEGVFEVTLYPQRWSWTLLISPGMDSIEIDATDLVSCVARVATAGASAEWIRAMRLIEAQCPLPAPLGKQVRRIYDDTAHRERSAPFVEVEALDARWLVPRGARCTVELYSPCGQFAVGELWATKKTNEMTISWLLTGLSQVS